MSSARRIAHDRFTGCEHDFRGRGIHAGSVRRDAARRRARDRTNGRRDLRGRGARRRPCRAQRRRGVRRRVGTPRCGGSRAAARAVRHGDRAARGAARADRVAGHRQADLASARRPRRDGALFRILRGRRRQAARRHDPVSAGLRRASAARAGRRDRAHHPVELPGADVRALARAFARRRERDGDQAVGRRVAIDRRAREARGGERHPGRRDQRRHGAR